MIQLLISVTNVDEAQIALENGADLIDLKDPNQGALGALPQNKILEIVVFVSAHDQYSKKLTSATIGDLPMQPQLILEHVVTLAETKVDIIKIGFFKAYDYQPCLDVLKSLTQKGLKLIAVLFAEYDYLDDGLEDLIVAIKNAGFYGVMLDTAHKNGATFLDYFSESEIMELANCVREQGLVFGLAGSLKLQHIAIAKKTTPTYMGFRGGVCVDHQRKLSLDADKIKAIRRML